MKGDAWELNDAAKAAAAVIPTATAVNVTPVQAMMPTIEVQAVPVQVQTTQVQPGAFTTDICDCCKDCPTCCAVTWCAPIVLGQLWERLKGPAGSCLKVSLLLWGAYMALSFWSYKDAKSRAEEALEAMRSKPTQAYNSYAPLDEALQGPNSLLVMCQWILGIIFIVMLAKLRAVVRQRDGISERQCHGCEDCCCSFWCSLCLMCQLLGHERLRGKYALCEATGEVGGISHV